MDNDKIPNKNDETAELNTPKDEPVKVKKKMMRKANGKLRKAPIVCMVIAALIIGGIIANIYNNNQLKPTFYRIESTKVSNNIRVVAISDMHLKEFGKNNNKLVSAIQSYHPDIIAVAGDMNIEKNPDYSIVLNLMRKLKPIAPVYYCLGNHEFDPMIFQDSQIYNDIKALGIHILHNEMEIVKVGDSQIDIIGMSQGPPTYAEYGAGFFMSAMESNDFFKLVLTHYPENFLGVIEDFDIDLAICGHAHGGLIRLPFIGGVYAPDQGFFPELCDGYHEISNSKVIVNRGLSTSGKIPRINNSPEISVIDINWY